MSFVKLHGSILDSSIWSESVEVRIVWVTMLAMADEHGVVAASVGGLARRAVVGIEACRAALEILSGPDPDTRDETTGERIEKVPGGWFILNHANYRERRTEQQIKTAARVAKHRAKRAGVTRNNVTPRNGRNDLSPPEAEAEAEADQITLPSGERARKPRPRTRKKPMVPYPDEGIPVTDALKTKARRYGMDLAGQLEAMRNWALSKDERRADWNAFAHGWLDREGTKPRQGNGQRAPDHVVDKRAIAAQDQTDDLIDRAMGLKPWRETQ